MAAQTIAADKVSVAATLTAAAADSVTFTGRTLSQCRLFWGGEGAGWYSVDGAAATVAGTHCYYLPPYPCSRLVPVLPYGSTTDLSIISAVAGTYVVEAA
jgi:hypothetical protein